MGGVAVLAPCGGGTYPPRTFFARAGGGQFFTFSLAFGPQPATKDMVTAQSAQSATTLRCMLSPCRPCVYGSVAPGQTTGRWRLSVQPDGMR